MSTAPIVMLAVTPAGELRDVTASGQHDVLSALYEAIGCDTVQLIHLDEESGVWVDEDARQRRDVQRGNVYASVVAHALGFPGVFLGTAVFSGLDDADDVTSVSDEVRTLIADIVTGLGPGGISHD